MLAVQDILLIKMIIKQRTQDKKIFLSICDDDLIGKKFEEKDFVLDLKSPFYDGKKLNKKDLKSLLLLYSC